MSFIVGILKLLTRISAFSVSISSIGFAPGSQDFGQLSWFPSIDVDISHDDPRSMQDDLRIAEEQVLEHPDDQASRLRLAQCREMLGSHEAAHGLYESIALGDLDDSRSVSIRIQALSALGRLEEAVQLTETLRSSVSFGSLDLYAAYIALAHGVVGGATLLSYFQPKSPRPFTCLKIELPVRRLRARGPQCGRSN